MMNDKIYYGVLNTLNAKVPYTKCVWKNSTLAGAFAEGHKDELDENWLRNWLLLDVEMGMLEYDEAVFLNPIYQDAIEELKKIY